MYINLYTKITKFMIILLSPAKTLDFSKKIQIENPTLPDLLPESEKLIKYLKTYSAEQLSELMNISSKLAQLNYDRYQKWHVPFTPENSLPAIYVFKGEVYKEFNIENLPEKNHKYMQQNLRILSGLYGILRPFDLIQPYRLEAGIKFSTDTFRNLYDFWNTKITEKLNQQMKTTQNNCIINLASAEYYKAIKIRKLDGKIITPLFKENKGNTFKTVAIYAKRARGEMARFIIENQIENPEEIKYYNQNGYVYNSQMSSSKEWVFIR